MGKVLQVRDIPDETYASLSRQATERGQSLSHFLRDQLDDIVRRNDSPAHNARIIRELRADIQTTVSTEDILAALDAGRSER